MRLTEEFKDQVQTVFDGRLRVRWSDSQQTLEIEQKIARKIDALVDESNDEMVRTRDGYLLLASVQPGDRMRCRQCHSELAVPVFEFKQVPCEFCRMKGRHVSYIVGFFEPNDRLIEYLRSLDPTNGASKRLRDELEDRNRRMLERRQRDINNTTESRVLDDFERIAGIQSVGYTGKESMWERT